MSITDEESIYNEYISIYASDLDNDDKLIKSCHFIIKISNCVKSKDKDIWVNILRNILIIYLSFSKNIEIEEIGKIERANIIIAMETLVS